MSKLKSLMNVFVSFDDDDEDSVPREADDDDLDVAVPAARQRVESGVPVGRPTQRRVSDYVEDPYAGELDEELLGDVTPDLSGADGTFDSIYKAAGLPPAAGAGFTIYKVEKILDSEHLAGLGHQAKAKAVLVTLEASGVGLTAVIQDAVARDKALDQFDTMLRRDLKNVETEVEIENASIEAEVAEYLEQKKQQIAANKQKVVQAKQLYSDWSAKKRQEEERLYSAVAPFVAENPITRDDT